MLQLGPCATAKAHKDSLKSSGPAAATEQAELVSFRLIGPLFTLQNHAPDCVCCDDEYLKTQPAFDARDVKSPWPRASLLCLFLPVAFPRRRHLII